MNLYKLLVEKIKNPIRKSFLNAQNITPLFPNKGELEKHKNSWMRGIITAPPNTLDPEFEKIQTTFKAMLKVSEERALRYIEDQWMEYMADVSQPKIEKQHHEKVYEQDGVQVFVDRRYVKDNYSKGSYNWRMVQNSIRSMLNYIRDILPNRKPRIVITKLSRHPVSRTVEHVSDSAGMYFKKIIYIDDVRIDDPKYFIHEYAHWVADRIPKQTERMLATAYDNILKKYFSKIKKKKIQGEDMSSEMRERISQRIGFPSGYGLLNEHEMFAVLIENWKSIPNNRVTYYYKNMVKNILTRL